MTNRYLELSWYKYIARYLANMSPGLSWPIASKFGHIWAAKILPAIVIKNNLNKASFHEEIALSKMFKQWAVSSVINYSLSRWNKAFIDKYIEIHGSKDLLSGRNETSFYLSDHCFFGFAILTLLGLNGHRVYAISLNLASTVPSHLSLIINKVYTDSARHFNGGRYLFTKIDGSFNKDMFEIICNKGSFYACVDFPRSVLGGATIKGSWEEMSFLNKTIEIPSRLFKFIFKNKIDSNFVHMRWDEQKNKLILYIESLDINKANSANEACSFYSNVLEKYVTNFPESWEGWKWPDVLKS